MNKIIISGSKGFIGSYTKKEFESHQWSVFDGEDVFNNKVKHADVWIHFKWYVKDKTSNVDYQLKSIKIALKALNEANKIGCKKFIFAGSIMEEELSQIMHKNIDEKIRPADVYASAKYCAEVMLKKKSEEYGIQLIRTTITNVYGVGEKSQRFVNSTIDKIFRFYKGDKSIKLNFSEGSQIYDFLYVTDAAKAYYFLAEKGICNVNYVLGSGDAKPLRLFIYDMLDEFKNELKNISPPIFAQPSLSVIDLPVDLFNIVNLRNIGWNPDVNWRKGLRLLWEEKCI
jgi:nucleoside-diphosphate-sugar epimerase